MTFNSKRRTKDGQKYFIKETNKKSELVKYLISKITENNRKQGGHNDHTDRNSKGVKHGNVKHTT